MIQNVNVSLLPKTNERRRVSGVSQACRGRVAGVSRACRGRVAGVSRACRGRVAGVSRACHGHGCSVENCGKTRKDVIFGPFCAFLSATFDLF
jgi:hypothetical protein